MILYIQTAFLGDLLLSIPTLKRLRELYPGKEIHLLCRKNLGSLLKENNLVDVVHDQFLGTKPNFSEVRNLFKKLHYDVVICPHQSFRSTWISATVRAVQKIGFSSWLGRWVFTECAVRPLQFPEVLRQMSLLKYIDPETNGKFADLTESTAPFKSIPSWTSMKLPQYQDIAKKKQWKTKHKLSLDKKIVCLAPGSVWPTKQWGIAKYSLLTQALLETGCQVVLVGSAGESSLCQKIESENPNVLNLAGQTSLLELAEVIAASDSVVSNDSGAMHIAAMTDTASVSIFGPTVLRFGYQPWNERARVLENKSLTCRPCSSHGGNVCPIGTHECMTSIPVPDVQKHLPKI